LNFFLDDIWNGAKTIELNHQTTSLPERTLKMSKISTPAYSIDGRSEPAKRAFDAAKAASTKLGLSTGGWVRLARVLSFDDNRSADGTTYILSCRKIHDGTKVQMGCGCPDWVYRKSHTNELCKHLVAFMTKAEMSPFETWNYRAGRAFLESMHAPELAEGEERLMLQYETATKLSK
jgi:hypothetical protein